MEEVSCADCQEELAATRLDGLPLDKRAVFEEHIHRCLECSSAREEYWKIDELAHKVLINDFSSRLGKNFWRKIEQREKEETFQDALHGLHQPTNMEALVIGLGGTGTEVVRRVKREELMRDYYLPVFQYLAIDTKESDEPLDMDPRMYLEDEECLYIGNCNPNKILKDLDFDSPIGKWWGNRDVSTELARVGDGAAQRRAVGRMGFFKSFSKIEARLRQVVQVFSHSRTNVESNGSPIIYLVFSLCGGTGSGIFFDVAYLLRKLFEPSAHPPTIVALAALPGSYLQSTSSILQQQRMQANTYAALIELDRLHMMVSGLHDKTEGNYLWKVQYDAHFTVESEELPFDYIYLFDDTDALGKMHKRQWVYEQMSRAIFWLSEPAVAARVRERARNVKDRVLEESTHEMLASEWRPPIYSVLGVSTVKFDRQCEHLPLDLEHIRNKYMRKTPSGKLMLPPCLQTDIALIKEMSRELNGVSPLPLGNTALLPSGTFDYQAEVNTMLEHFHKKYKAALDKLPTSPMWLRRREQQAITTLIALSECVLNAFCANDATAVLQTLEEIHEQLHTLRRGIIAKMLEQQSHKTQIEQGFLNEFKRKMHVAEPKGTLAKLLRNLLKSVDYVNGRDLTQKAEKDAQQLYQWYTASSRVIIYGDIVKTLLDPLLNYTGEHRQGFIDIEQYLNTWLRYIQLPVSMQQNMRDWSLCENIYPRFSIHDQRQIAISRYKLNLDIPMQQQPRQDQPFPEQVQSRSLAIEEHLVERLVSQELSSKRQAFLDRAEYLWNFTLGSNKEMIPCLELVNLLGYSIDPRQDASLSLEPGIQALFGDQSFPPELVATGRRDEMVLLKTLHGLTSSSIRSINEMKQAYNLMNPTSRDPYLHLSPDLPEILYIDSKDLRLQTERKNQKKRIIPKQPTPQEVIKAWNGLEETLAGSRDLAKKVSKAVREYELASTSALQEKIIVDRPDHPFFDFIDSLLAILTLPRASYPLQVQDAFSEMEEILRIHGWEQFIPERNDDFNPKLHKKDETFFGDENGQDEWAFVTERGRAFRAKHLRKRTLRVIEVIRSGYKHTKTDQVRQALVIVSTESDSNNDLGNIYT